jgi:hypothetical protein
LENYITRFLVLTSSSSFLPSFGKSSVQIAFIAQKGALSFEKREILILVVGVCFASPKGKPNPPTIINNYNNGKPNNRRKDTKK